MPITAEYALTISYDTAWVVFGGVVLILSVAGIILAAEGRLSDDEADWWASHEFMFCVYFLAACVALALKRKGWW